MSVITNSPFHDSFHLDDQIPSYNLHDLKITLNPNPKITLMDMEWT